MKLSCWNLFAEVGKYARVSSVCSIHVFKVLNSWKSASNQTTKFVCCLNAGDRSWICATFWGCKCYVKRHSHCTQYCMRSATLSNWRSVAKQSVRWLSWWCEWPWQATVDPHREVTHDKEWSYSYWASTDKEILTKRLHSLRLRAHFCILFRSNTDWLTDWSLLYLIPDSNKRHDNIETHTQKKLTTTRNSYTARNKTYMCMHQLYDTQYNRGQ